MGSSTKKKREKKQDFQKVKLKVGKTKPKAANQTDTSFRSKAIVLNQQSLNVTAPSVAYQFGHHVSMLSSRSDSQRKDSLAFLATYFSTRPVDSSLPQPIGSLLDKLCPLILDGSNSVRNQLLKMFQTLGPKELDDHVSKILPFARAGMTHLSRDIRLSTTGFLSWLLDVAGDEVVSCPGGWTKTLDSFITLLGWKGLGGTSTWSSGKSTFGNDTKLTVRVMQVLARLLEVGFGIPFDETDLVAKSMVTLFPLWHTTTHAISNKSNAYFYLDLFGKQQAEEGQIMDDRDDRIAVFNNNFRTFIMMGIEAAKQEGGELGRAAGSITKSLKLANVG